MFATNLTFCHIDFGSLVSSLSAQSNTIAKSNVPRGRVWGVKTVLSLVKKSKLLGTSELITNVVSLPSFSKNLPRASMLPKASASGKAWVVSKIFLLFSQGYDVTRSISLNYSDFFKALEISSACC